MSMPERRTCPWRPRELLGFNGFRLWYGANALGVIEHVFMPGGRCVPYDDFVRLAQSMKVKIAYPSEVREP